MRNILFNFCSPKLYMTHALILRNLKQSHSLWHTGKSLHLIKHKNLQDIFVYLHRQSQLHLLPVITLYIEGGKQVKCPAGVCLFVDSFTLLVKLITNRRQARRTLERLKTWRKYFSLKFWSSLSDLYLFQQHLGMHNLSEPFICS